MFKQKKSLIGYVMNIFLLGEELFEKIEKKQLGSYLLSNNKKIISSLNINTYEERRDIVTKFLQNRFMKKNYKELSDFVDTYYNKSRGI